MRHPCHVILLVAMTPLLTFPDSVKPVEFGPFMVNHISYTGNPAAYHYVLNNGYYRFLVGWIEPISENSSGIFKDAYFETDGDINISPFQSDLGTTFNLKPIRYLEVGLSYNRLMFHNSLVTFNDPDTNARMIDRKRALPGKLIYLDHEFGGADVFTFQANLTFDLGPTQLYIMGSRALWDIDAPGEKFAYEWGTDMVIKTRDRINSVQVRWSLDLSRYSRNPAYSFTGLAIRNQYWSTDYTKQVKNLVAAGFTGFRLGRNPERQRRGLDLFVGYWTIHPQVSSSDAVKSLNLAAEWTWNVQFLKL